MKQIAAILMLLGLASPGAMGSPTDFARGRVADVDPVASVHRLRLPQDVYEWVARDDLGDLRVFNGHGDEVAYSVRRPAITEEQTAWTGLPLFAWPKAGPGSAENAEVNIELADGGAVVAVRGATVTGEGPNAYLIDATGYQQPIDELQLAWMDGTDDFVATVTVETSDDLASWHTLRSGATVATLSTNDQQVRLDRIEIAGARAKYLRITQTDDGAPLEIAQVNARRQETRAPERAWKSLDGLKVDNGYEFNTNGRFPIDRINVKFDGETYLAEVQLFSRANETVKWRNRGKRAFYRTAVDGRVAVADPIKYAVIRDPLWRAEVLGENGDGPPTVAIGWAPDDVTFLRQGPPPFTLAYGRADTVGRAWPMRDLLRALEEGQELNDLPVTPLGQAAMLGGPDRLLPAPEPVNWRNVVLWVVLVIGVVVIGGLAIRLAREG